MRITCLFRTKAVILYAYKIVGSNAPEKEEYEEIFSFNYFIDVFEL